MIYRIFLCLFLWAESCLAANNILTYPGTNAEKLSEKTHFFCSPFNYNGQKMWFVAEKVTEANCELYKKFADMQKEFFSSAFGQGIAGFKGALYYFIKYLTNKANCYVTYISKGEQPPTSIMEWDNSNFAKYNQDEFKAYCESIEYCSVTPEKEKTKIKPPAFKDILIFSTVTVLKCLDTTNNKDEFNIATHMGISKTAMLSSLLKGFDVDLDGDSDEIVKKVKESNSNKKNSGLSIPLHRLMAEFILKIFPKVKYQINKPIEAMLNVFLKYFNTINSIRKFF